MKTLKQLEFNNTFYRLGKPFYSEVKPHGISKPFLVSASDKVVQLIGLDRNELAHPYFVEVFSGNTPLPGFQTLAMAYSGHQFGIYNPQLGDGRCVLRSSIREYLCSEAMAGLGIPTTRSLCVIGGGDNVYRETVEKSAVLVRVAESHVRFGSFEYFHYTENYDAVRQLADYVIDHHFPGVSQAGDKYEQFFAAVIKCTAVMIAHWQAFGFAHGVMNTDSMSILGQTFDYGPFGFMDDYDPGYICNHSDVRGRYAFDHQPQIGLSNLNALGYALTSLMSEAVLSEL